MRVVIYNNNPMETNCYVLETDDVAIVIDPCYSYDLLPNKIKDKLQNLFLLLMDILIILHFRDI